jgi:hypothetical protein
LTIVFFEFKILTSFLNKEQIVEYFYNSKSISFSSNSANFKTSLSFSGALFMLMLTGKLFSRPIGKLKEGSPAKLAKRSKLSLQWVSLPRETKAVSLIFGAGWLVLGKIKKLCFRKSWLVHFFTFCRQE